MPSTDRPVVSRHGPQIVGVDTGGTFTDFVCHDDEGLRTHKLLSTPAAPEQAILAGLAALNVDPLRARLVHGSTVGTNAVLEGRGARTAFVTNRGLADLLAIGRQARRALYDLTPVPVPPPVPPELCLETGGRLAADGTVVEPLSDADLEQLRTAIAACAPEAVAICLLFSFLDDRFERAVAAAMPAALFVSRSSAVLPVLREYERAMATWLNAYVGPLLQRYLERLAASIAPAPVAVMQSSGLTCDAAQAGRLAVHLLLSGPAGGLAGARAVGSTAGIARLLTFDMGGTSTDVAIVDGDIRLTRHGRIGPYPVAVPMADIHTIGAGGGSIAFVDAGGALQVGPRSAGAVPGPVCYGRGGREPTVTDANVVLGRIPAGAHLAGQLAVDGEAARAALAALARRLALGGAAAAAIGVLRLANDHMVQALRVVSVQRGIDPHEYVLTSFGGAGGLHVCDLAELLGLQRALVPQNPGVLSAFGMVVAPAGRELSHTVGLPLAALAATAIDAGFAGLAERGEVQLRAEGIASARIERHARLELCYRGQSAALDVDWAGDPAAAQAAFHAAHEACYGHRLDAPVELVNLHLGLRGPAAVLTTRAPAAPAAPRPATRAPVHGQAEPVPVYRRTDLAAGAQIEGPAIVTESGATTWIAPHWSARVDNCGNLHLLRRDGAR